MLVRCSSNLQKSKNDRKIALCAHMHYTLIKLPINIIVREEDGNAERLEKGILKRH
jgi:hypothetical protein